MVEESTELKRRAEQTLHRVEHVAEAITERVDNVLASPPVVALRRHPIAWASAFGISLIGVTVLIMGGLIYVLARLATRR